MLTNIRWHENMQQECQKAHFEMLAHLVEIHYDIMSILKGLSLYTLSSPILCVWLSLEI